MAAGFVYTSTGGTFPFQANSFGDWLPAIWSVLALAMLPIIIYFLALFISLCLAVAFTNMLAYFLSQFNLLTQTRSKELRTLENLGEELIIAPADGSTL